MVHSVLQPVIAYTKGTVMNQQQDIRLINLSKQFEGHNGKLRIICKDLNMCFPGGEVTCILGESGCGKSTLLNLIAGFSKPDGGEVQLPEDYKVGIAFQENVLFPWKTVMGNLLFACKKQYKYPQKVIREYLDKANLRYTENFYPQQLSGGMQQRIALIRILLTKPNLVILDESFGALDFKTRAEMQQLFIDLQQEEHFTGIVVTHDLLEATRLGDEILILRGEPLEYERINNSSLNKHSVEELASYLQ